MKRLIEHKRRIGIICEGNEEYDYIERLKQLGVWSTCYDIYCINAEGNGNIPARYQDAYQNDYYEYIFVFCDTDKKPYEQYEDIKRKINEFHGVEGAADEIVIFGNPCTLQIICLHWDQLILKTNSKKVNAEIIERYTGIADYKAKKEQRESVFANVNVENYGLMKSRVEELSQDDTMVNSSNFKKLIDYLEDSNDKWIDDLNKQIEDIG